jgi:hypothetical protein
VSYFVDRNPQTGELGLWRRRDPTRDPDPLEGGVREEIATGIAGFGLEYYDGFSWHDTWGKTAAETSTEETTALTRYANRYGMPEAVRITLAFSQESLVFQTVVHLRLARKAMTSSLGTTGAEGSPAGADGAPPGGTNMPPGGRGGNP